MIWEEMLFSCKPDNVILSANYFLETEYYFLEAHVYNTDVLVVVFEPAGGEDPRPNGFRTGWGVEVFRKRRCSVLAVKPKRVNWYVTPDLSIAFSHLERFLSMFRRVVTYGVSMGGFGALCYADTLGAKQVFAFSPQTTLDRAKIIDDRFPRSKDWDFSSCHGDVVGKLNRVNAVYIFYDKNAPLDRAHVDRLDKSKLIRVNIPGSGHSAIELARECGALRLLISDIISGDVDVAGFCKEMRNRKGIESYHREIVSQWRQRHGSRNGVPNRA